MILHLLPDHQFSRMARRDFSRIAPEVNQFVSMSATTTMEIRRLLETGRFSSVVLHSLRDAHARLLEHVPAAVRIVWIGWGFDYYPRLLDRMHEGGLLLPDTTACVRATLSRGATIRSWVHHLRQHFTGAGIERHHLERVDLFIPVLDLEHQLAREWNPWFAADYQPWNYGTAEDDLLPEGTVTIGGDNILVGNSAAPENNHIEVLEALADVDPCPSGSVIVPLGYGGTRYRVGVVEVGRRLFGARFVPIMEFMPKERFLELLAGCRIVLMNHLRQQGLGTVLSAMWCGAAVTLNRRSPLFAWLRDRGLEVGGFSPERTDGGEFLRSISTEKQAGNRALVESLWGRRAADAKTKALVERLLS